MPAKPKLAKVLRFPKPKPAIMSERESLTRLILLQEEREVAVLQKNIAKHRAMLREESGSGNGAALKPNLVSPTFARFQAGRTKEVQHAS